MRKRLARIPSPAMGVAFVALIAALTGTAVALPGSNTVTSGDIANGQVKTQDIRNSTVRGRDVRNGTLTGSDVNNNSLTGSDVNEGSLGTVPRAGVANLAGTANLATRASSAASVDKLVVSNRANRAFGDPFDSTGGVLLATRGEFSLRLLCDEDAGDHFSDLILVGPAGSIGQDGGGNQLDFDTAPNNFILVSSAQDVGGGGATAFTANLANVAATSPSGAGIQARGYTGINIPGTPTECVGGGTLEG